MKTITNIIYPTFALFAFACFALLPAPNAFGVVPAPDGGYPGFNTAEGQNALLHLTTGTANTALGWVSLENVTAGSFNTGCWRWNPCAQQRRSEYGHWRCSALAEHHRQPTTRPMERLPFLTTPKAAATRPVVLSALNSNTTGNGNTATGDRALLSNTTGEVNTATGDSALLNNTTGNFNTAIGDSALINSTTGDFNTALGAQLANVTTANNVIAIGTSRRT